MYYEDYCFREYNLCSSYCFREYNLIFLWNISGIVTLINIMSRFGKHSETESEIKHNERLEFLGDAVVEFLSSIHLFRMFPGLAEGGLATYRAAIVQNQHLAQLAKVKSV